jgi:hypothetical protein
MNIKKLGEKEPEKRGVKKDAMFKLHRKQACIIILMSFNKHLS